MHVTVILTGGVRSDWLSGGEIRVVLISGRVTQETLYWAISVFESTVNEDDIFKVRCFSWLHNMVIEDENVKDKLHWVLLIEV